MGVHKWFMEVARGVLPPATFDEIFSRAVEKERKEIENRPGEPADPVVSNRNLAVVAAHLGSDVNPKDVKVHAEERMGSRLGVEVSQCDMADLLRFVQAGGPNVRVIRQKLELTQELVINWRGLHFNVVWSKSRGKLITVYPKTRKKKRKVWKGRQADDRFVSDEDFEDGRNGSQEAA